MYSPKCVGDPAAREACSQAGKNVNVVQMNNDRTAKLVVEDLIDKGTLQGYSETERQVLKMIWSESFPDSDQMVGVA